MKFATLCLTLLLMLTVVCQFAAFGEGGYNDGDITPTNRAEWWWKYVRKIHPQWENDIIVSNVAVGNDIVDLRTQDLTTPVAFTFQNRSSQTVSYQGSITLRHTI